jgi:hypothetical protein
MKLGSFKKEDFEDIVAVLPTQIVAVMPLVAVISDIAACSNLTDLDRKLLEMGITELGDSETVRALLEVLRTV